MFLLLSILVNLEEKPRESNWFLQGLKISGKNVEELRSRDKKNSSIFTGNFSLREVKISFTCPQGC